MSGDGQMGPPAGGDDVQDAQASEPSIASVPSDPPAEDADALDAAEGVQFEDDDDTADAVSVPTTHTPVPVRSATVSKSASPVPTSVSPVPVPPAAKLSAPGAAANNGSSKPAAPASAATASRTMKRPFAAIDGPGAGAGSDKVGWADLVVLVDMLLEKGVVGCLDEAAVSHIISVFFDACRHSSSSDIVMQFLQKIRLTSSGQQKAVLFNLLTAFWVRCWGRKWVPPAHAKVDMVLRTVLLRALRFSTVHTGPEANADIIDATVCSWCYLELIDQTYLELLRTHLFDLKQPVAAPEAAEAAS